MSIPRILAITGGVGGAKLALGLTRLLPPSEVGFLVNTGDDFEHLGLHVSPDIDTLVYTLSGEANSDTGWGRAGESWQFMEAMEQLGGETWFRLGDKDLAMHIERTARLRSGQGLTEVTRDLAQALGVAYPLLPMSEQSVRTRVNTDSGWMDFQHYFVREQCRPRVTGFSFEGAERARINPQALRWIESGALHGVIICPSNPFVSIDPVLSLPGMKESLSACEAPVIAVSPVVGGQAIKGPTVKMMQELGVPNSAQWVASHYEEILDGFIIDVEDAAAKPEITGMGMEVEVTQTVMSSIEDRVNLARACLALLDELNS